MLFALKMKLNLGGDVSSGDMHFIFFFKLWSSEEETDLESPFLKIIN